MYSWDTDTGTVAHMYEAGHKGPVQYASVYNLPSYGRCVVSCGAKDHTVVSREGASRVPFVAAGTIAGYGGIKCLEGVGRCFSWSQG